MKDLYLQLKSDSPVDLMCINIMNFIFLELIELANLVTISVAILKLPKCDALQCHLFYYYLHFLIFLLLLFFMFLP